MKNKNLLSELARMKKLSRIIKENANDSEEFAVMIAEELESRWTNGEIGQIEYNQAMNYLSEDDHQDQIYSKFGPSDYSGAADYLMMQSHASSLGSSDQIGEGVESEENRAVNDLGYWYCPKCDVEVDAKNVTFDEKHDLCGTDVIWQSEYELSEGRELDGGLTYDTLPIEIKDAYKRNKAISVAFVKKDGSVRHMSFRRSLKAYEKSEKEKTQAQMDVLRNNNLMNVYDTNVYIKLKRETGDPAMAAKGSFRNFRLDNVLAFLTGGQLFDMREENNIKERYGEEVYDTLTRSMVSALEKSEKDASISDENYINESIIRKEIRSILKENEQLNNILHSYLETALWADGDELDGANIHSDINNDSKIEAFLDVKKFVQQAGNLIDGLTDEQIGHDLWLTRNRHGSGFWDRNLGDAGDKLTKIAQDMGGKNLYRGDDGEIYID